MTAGAPRIVVVLGYSDRGRGEIHPVCAARLAHARQVATPDDVVMLSGWARVRGTRSEAELMSAAWTGSAREVIVEADARTTVANAANALDDIRRVGAREVVIVTSSWHARRARAAFRRLLRNDEVRVTVTTPQGRSARGALRELALWPLLPAQLLHALRRPAR